MLETDFIPASEKDSRQLMIMLHGLGDSMEGYRWFPEAMRLPWLNYLLVNAPDEYYGGYSWYEFGGNALPGIQRSSILLFKLLEDLRVKGYPADQITLGGFSQGCLMSLEVGLRHRQVFAGIVGISGYVFEPEKLLSELSPVARQQRLLITHGTMDPLLNIDRIRRQIDLLKAAGLQIEWREFDKEHTIAGEAEMAVIREFVRAGYPSVVGKE